MAVLLDAGILYAAYDADDQWHGRARDVLLQEKGLLIVPSPVIPEVDHFLRKWVGSVGQIRFYEALASGHYFIADLPKEKYPRVAELNRQFANLSLGFVDAAVVAISESLGLPRIATTDRRHFTPLAAALSLELLP